MMYLNCVYAAVSICMSSKMLTQITHVLVSQVMMPQDKHDTHVLAHCTDNQEMSCTCTTNWCDLKHSLGKANPFHVVVIMQ